MITLYELLYTQKDDLLVIVIMNFLKLVQKIIDQSKEPFSSRFAVQSIYELSLYPSCYYSHEDWFQAHYSSITENILNIEPDHLAGIIFYTTALKYYNNSL